MTIFESDYLLIRYDQENQIILEEWQNCYRTIPQSETFREPLEKLLETVKGNTITKWLIDNTEQNTVFDNDQIWFEDYYLSKLVEAGIQTVALVNAKKILRNNGAKNILETLNKKIRIGIFNKNIEAKQWLTSI